MHLPGDGTCNAGLLASLAKPAKKPICLHQADSCIQTCKGFKGASQGLVVYGKKPLHFCMPAGDSTEGADPFEHLARPANKQSVCTKQMTRIQTQKIQWCIKKFWLYISAMRATNCRDCQQGKTCRDCRHCIPICQCLCNLPNLCRKLGCALTINKCDVNSALRTLTARGNAVAQQWRCSAWSQQHVAA